MAIHAGLGVISHVRVTASVDERVCTDAHSQAESNAQNDPLRQAQLSYVCSPHVIYTPLRSHSVIPKSLLSRVTFYALERRYVPKIYGMFERFIGLVAGFAFAIGQSAKIHWMAERSGLSILGRWPGRIEDNRVADVAIVSDNLAGITHVFSVVAAEASREMKMPDIVGVGRPVSLHLREEVCLKDTLGFRDRAFNRRLPLHINIRVVGLVKLIQVLFNRS